MQDRTRLLQELSLSLRQHMMQNGKQGLTLLEQLGLTIPQAHVIAIVNESGGSCTMQDLAMQAHKAGGTLTGIVDRLYSMGLLERTHDPADRRVVIVRLTDAGYARLKQMELLNQEYLERVVSLFSDSELEQFLILMQKYVQGMERVRPRLQELRGSGSISRQGSDLFCDDH